MMQGLSRTLREIHRLSREASAAGFQDATFEAMKGLVRFDTGYWGGGRVPVESVTIHYAHLHRLPAEEMHAAFEKTKSHPKHVEFITRCVINVGQAQTFDVREVGLDFFYCPYGVDQIVTLYQYDDDLGLYHVLSLYRSGAERFTEQERLLFESAVPHLLDAWRESRLVHMSGAGRDFCPLTPAALVDKEGVVHFARPAFIELLRREFPGWCGPYLPEAMRRMRDGAFVGETVALRFAPRQDLFLALGRNKGSLDQLTARELEVAKQMAQGASHKEIARDLAIAPATVRNYIAHVHAKLGSNKVAQVATMLLSEGVL